MLLRSLMSASHLVNRFSILAAKLRRSFLGSFKIERHGVMTAPSNSKTNPSAPESSLSSFKMVASFDSLSEELIVRIVGCTSDYDILCNLCLTSKKLNRISTQR